MLPKFSYFGPKSLKEAVDALDGDGCRIHAGGTDLLGCMREGLFDVKKMVSISRIENLKGITETPDGGLRIGAQATITQVAEHPLVQKNYPGLSRAASEVASPQLRNQGTLGGNLCQKPRCWYYRGDFHCLRKGGDTCYAATGENQFHCIFGSGDICFVVHPSDTAPVLTALGASAALVGSTGRRVVKLDEFFVLPEDDVTRETVVKPGEILTEIMLPAPVKGQRSSYRKIRARQSWDFALVGAALSVVMDGKVMKKVDVVLGGVAPVPWRSHKAEAVLKGKKVSEAVFRDAARAAVEDAEPTDMNAYKVDLVKGVLVEELTKLTA